MTVGPATAGIVTRLHHLADSLDGTTAERVGEIHTSVAGPFVVAIAGRLKAGKSTLVNALLGRNVAPVAVGECTKLVTRFVRGDSELVTVHRKDGTARDLPLADGRIPLDVGGGDIDHLDVSLATSALDGMVLVDTPGLASLVTENSDRTEDFLDLESQRACAGADAVIYLLNGIARADDVDVLRRFVSAAGDRYGVNAIAVLNKADQVTGGIEAARRQSVALRSTLGGLANAVVPVVALAAQASRCGLVNNADLGHLATIAALDAETRAMMTSDYELFAVAEAAVPEEVRSRLASQLGLLGIATLVEHLAANPRDRAGAVDQLDEVSQFAELDRLFERLQRRSDAIKAQAALSALERLAWAPGMTQAEAALIRRALDDLRAHPAMVVIEQASVLDRVAGDPTVLDDAERAEIDLLFTSGDAAERLRCAPHDVEAVAWEVARRWQAVSASPSNPLRREVARVARLTSLGIWEAARTFEPSLRPTPGRTSA